jgi:hypothetical protein
MCKWTLLRWFIPHQPARSRIHRLLDGLAAHGTRRCSRLGQLLRTPRAHALVTARHDEMVHGRVKAHHAYRLLRIRLRCARSHSRAPPAAAAPPPPEPLLEPQALCSLRRSLHRRSYKLPVLQAPLPPPSLAPPAPLWPAQSSSSPPPPALPAVHCDPRASPPRSAVASSTAPSIR